MGETESDDSRLAGLSEVYGVLQKDAKEMSKDLIEGVSMWRSAAIISLILAALSAAVAVVILTYVGINQTVIAINVAEKAKYTYEEFRLGVILIVMSLFVLAGIAGFAGSRYLQRFGELRKKYSDLYKIIEKQS